MTLSEVQLALIGAALIVNVVPALKVIPKYFVTLFHESGHALGSFITGGGVVGIVVFKNGEGVTTTSHAVSIKGFFSRVVTKIAGYPAPILWATIFLVSALTLSPATVLAIIAGVGVVNLFLSRSFFTLFINVIYLLVPTLIMFIDKWEPTVAVTNYAVFLGAMLFFGVFKTLKDLITLTLKSPEVETDATLLSQDLRVSPKISLVLILIASLVTILAPILFLI